MTEPRLALTGVMLFASAMAWAQPAPQPSAVASAAERAQKETDGTMYWIRVLADKPAPVKTRPMVAAAAPAPDIAPTPPVEPDPGWVQIKSVQPDFPTAILRRVHKGNVEVRFEVEPEGKVVDASVVESSHPRLNDAAVEAVRQWRFKPTAKARTAVVNLVFDIDNEQ